MYEADNALLSHYSQHQNDAFFELCNLFIFLDDNLSTVYIHFLNKNYMNDWYLSVTALIAIKFYLLCHYL